MNRPLTVSGVSSRLASKLIPWPKKFFSLIPPPSTSPLVPKPACKEISPDGRSSTSKSIILKYKKNYSYKSIFYKENISQSLIGYKIIKEVFKKHEKTIILEDDCVPEVGFFRYCDLMLKKFKRNKDIAHISGCNLYYGSKKKK